MSKRRYSGRLDREWQRSLAAVRNDAICQRIALAIVEHNRTYRRADRAACAAFEDACLDAGFIVPHNMNRAIAFDVALSAAIRGAERREETYRRDFRPEEWPAT